MQRDHGESHADILRSLRADFGKHDPEAFREDWYMRLPKIIDQNGLTFRVSGESGVAYPLRGLRGPGMVLSLISDVGMDGQRVVRMTVVEPASGIEVRAQENPLAPGLFVTQIIGNGIVGMAAVAAEGTIMEENLQPLVDADMIDDLDDAPGNQPVFRAALMALYAAPSLLGLERAYKDTFKNEADYIRAALRFQEEARRSL